MKNRFFRVGISLLLVTSVWFGSLSAFAQQSGSQSNSNNSNQNNSNNGVQTPSGSNANQTRGGARRPLATNEDPSLIGKRKINSPGFTKIFQRSIESEVALGRQLSAEIDRESKFIDDPVITEYVNRVGQNIVLHSDSKIPFTIKVVDSDEVNAFALPGGFFYVNRGLILAADNEAELAGVMAHEIAHVAARHAVENEAKATMAQYGLMAGSIFLGGLGGALLLNGAQFATLLGFMKFSRDAESEADRLGVQYLYSAGYDPNALATMFEKLLSKNKKKPGTISKLFATHPQTEERRSDTLALVGRFPEREEYIINTSEFQRVKARLLRMSNARATNLGNTDPNDPGSQRPTLKRRSPSADPNAPATDDGTTPTDAPERPRLKRNPNSAPDNSNQP